MPLFQVLLATATGAAHELDLHAPDACTAAWLAGDEIRQHDPHVVVIHVHARRVAHGHDYIRAAIHDGP